MIEFRYMMGKWIYGFKAVKATVESCKIAENMRVLNLGSGFGKTTCYIAKRFECRVVAMDLLKGAVAISNYQILNAGLNDRVTVHLADPARLPFDDHSFDAVIIESFLSFVTNKSGALAECFRLLKPDGYLAALEMSFLSDATSEFRKGTSTLFGLRAAPLAHENWIKLLASFGLKNLTAQSFRLNLIRKFVEDFALERSDAAVEFFRMVTANVRNPMARSITLNFLSLFINDSKYLGYGIYSGQKR